MARRPRYLNLTSSLRNNSRGSNGHDWVGRMPIRSARRFALTMTWVAALLGTAVSAEEQECSIPDPPGVPSAMMPGLSVSYLHDIFVKSLPQPPWKLVHDDSNTVAVRRPLGEDRRMRQGWEDFAGASNAVSYFDERRWLLEALVDGTIVTVRDYLVIVGDDGDERVLEYLDRGWMHDIQCILGEIRSIAVKGQDEPGR